MKNRRPFACWKDSWTYIFPISGTMIRSTAERYSDATGYPDMAKEAILEMHRQAGRLKIRDDIAARAVSSYASWCSPAFMNRCGTFSCGYGTRWGAKPGSASWASIIRSIVPVIFRKSTGPSPRPNTRNVSAILMNSASKTALSRKWDRARIIRRTLRELPT